MIRECQGGCALIILEPCNTSSPKERPDAGYSTMAGTGKDFCDGWEGCCAPLPVKLVQFDGEQTAS